jgi:hypothetical protein
MIGRRSKVDIIDYHRIHSSIRLQLEKIVVLLECLNIRDIAIEDFLMEALDVLENGDFSTLSRAADVFEDGMCILDDLGFIDRDAKFVAQKLSSPAFDGIDIKGLTQIITGWARVEVPHV